MVTNMTTSATAPFGTVIPRHEAETYCQPAPSHGTMNTILSPRNCPSNAFSHGSMPSNMFAMGTQTIPPGGRLGPRAFAVGEAAFFVYRGTGRATGNGRVTEVAPETLIYVGRGAPHDIENDGRDDLSFAWVTVPPRLAALLSRIGRTRTPGTPPPPPFDAPADAARLYAHAGLVRGE
jgi:mannose-6-phosphate isomerase-like protein (cupin superfamily)